VGFLNACVMEMDVGGGNLEEQGGTGRAPSAGGRAPTSGGHPSCPFSTPSIAWSLRQKMTHGWWLVGGKNASEWKHVGGSHNMMGCV